MTATVSSKVPSSSSTATALPVEAIFAQKLAANDPKIRDRAVKKLSAFLKSRASAPNGHAFTEDEMLKIWKGLHYCFWMSDKPLVQEELAEKISRLVLVFADQPSTSSAVLFIHSALVTLGREWIGIDRLRMDKFMMLVRRILRQTFFLAKGKGWSTDFVENLVRVFEEDVVCANKSVRDFKTSLGFQLHFADVFLEELAKVGGEELDDKVIRKLLAPFVKELREGKEDRLKSHIEERVFQHLMRQSDAGIAYEEEEEEECDIGQEEGEDGAEKAESDDSEGTGEDEEEEAMGDLADSPKDPRAGKVDVTIPQLMMDYKKLADDLFAAGSDKNVQQAARRILFRLTKQFRALADGRFPLAAELSDEEEEEEEEGASKIKVKKMIKAKRAEEASEMERRREERKEYKAIMREKRKRETGDDEEEDAEEDGDKTNKKKKRKVEKQSPVFKKKDLKRKSQDSSSAQRRKESPGKPSMNGVASVPKASKGDSGLEKTGTKKKKKTNKMNGVSTVNVVEMEVGEEKQTKEKKKKKKLKNIQRATEVTPMSDSGDACERKVVSPMGAGKGLANVDTPNINVFQRKKDKGLPTSVPSSAEKPHTKLMTKDHLPKTGLPGFSPPTIKSTPTNVMPTFFKKAAAKSAAAAVVVVKTSPSKKKKSSSSAKSMTEPRPNSISSSVTTATKRKRINFALTCNKYQSVLDHSLSVSESPDIPFSAEKRPKQGVLKNKNDISVVSTPSPLLGSARAVQKNTKINSKSKTMQVLGRMRATDYF